MANHDIAYEHIDQIEAMRDMADGLLEAGQAQKRLTDLNREILQEERRHWFWERLSYWAAGLIAIGVSL